MNALIIIDMWDNHWCDQALKQSKSIVPLINNTANKFRDEGHIIIHAPSGIKMTKYYHNWTQWLNYKINRKYENIFPIDSLELPIYSGIGSCPDTTIMTQPWNSIHKDILIHKQDYISNSAGKIFTFLDDNNIDYIYVCGLHLNMCILKNSYGIINLVKYGFKIKLLSELTDVMYNPKTKPFVTTGQAKRIIIKYISETYCEVI